MTNATACWLLQDLDQLRPMANVTYWPTFTYSASVKLSVQAVVCVDCFVV